MTISLADAFNQTLSHFKITAREISKRSGLQEGTISEFRSGKVETRLRTVETIINALPDEARNYMFFKILVSELNDADIPNFLIEIALHMQKTAKNKELIEV